MTLVINKDHIEIFESALEIVTKQHEDEIIQSIVEDATPVLEEMCSLGDGEDGSVSSREMDSARTVLELAARHVDDEDRAETFLKTADWFGAITYTRTWPKYTTASFSYQNEK